MNDAGHLEPLGVGRSVRVSRAYEMHVAHLKYTHSETEEVEDVMDEHTESREANTDSIQPANVLGLQGWVEEKLEEIVEENRGGDTAGCLHRAED